MRIYVPSRSRADQIGTRAMTHDWIKAAVYVVPLVEVKDYERVLASRGRYEVVGCPEDGIAATRRWIGEHARDTKVSKFVMMDDDLMFAVRKSADGNLLRPAETKDIDDMLDWTESALDEYAHASVSARAVANTQPMKSGGIDMLYQENKRTLRYLAYRTEEFLSVEHGRVPVMEDFDVNLQLLEKGHKNVLHYWWAQDQRETGTAGGCSSYRTLEKHNAAARRLAELHPGIVTLRTKTVKQSLTKTAEALRERLEVTIQWVKAWESSQ